MPEDAPTSSSAQPATPPQPVAVQLYERALAAGRAGRLDEQDELFLQSIQENRNFGPAYIAIAQRLVGAGKLEDAFVYLNEVQRLGSLPPQMEPMLRQIEQHPSFRVDALRTYRERCGVLPPAKTPEPRRVLLITNLFPPQELGGYGRRMSEFAAELQRRGHTIRVLAGDAPYLAKQGEADEHWAQYASHNLELHGSWKDGVTTIWPDNQKVAESVRKNHARIREEIARFQPDWVLLGNMDFVGTAFMQDIADACLPTVHCLGHAHPGYATTTQPRNGHFAYAPNSEFTRKTIAAGGFDTSNAAIVYPGASLGHFYTAVLPSYRELKIAFAGILLPYKGPQTLIEALKLLKDEGIPFSATLAGETTDIDFVRYLYGLVVRYGIKDQVHFSGFLGRRDLARLYRQSNVLAFPTVIPETFGRSQVEAMAAGLCVITSATGGSGEVVQHQVNGLHTKPQDPEDLAKQLAFLYRNPERWEAISRAGQDRAFAFTTGQSITALEGLFRRLER